MSLNLEGFLADVKRAALEAVKASKTFSLCFGTVVGESPLQISVDQKLTLYGEQLILTNAVRDFSVSYAEEDSDEEKKTTVLLGLKTGEKVLLLRADGGRKYIVLDRVGEEN